MNETLGDVSHLSTVIGGREGFKIMKICRRPKSMVPKLSPPIVLFPLKQPRYSIPLKSLNKYVLKTERDKQFQNNFNRTSKMFNNIVSYFYECHSSRAGLMYQILNPALKSFRFHYEPSKPF